MSKMKIAYVMIPGYKPPVALLFFDTKTKYKYNVKKKKVSNRSLTFFQYIFLLCSLSYYMVWFTDFGKNVCSLPIYYDY